MAKENDDNGGHCSGYIVVKVFILLRWCGLFWWWELGEKKEYKKRRPHTLMDSCDKKETDSWAEGMQCEKKTGIVIRFQNRMAQFFI